MPTAYTVRQLTNGLSKGLAALFPGEVWVEGEIAELKRSRSGHVYFQLVEPAEAGRGPDASVDVTLFDAARRHVNRILNEHGGVRMEDGMKVRIRGRVELYAPQGKLFLRMSGIDPAYTIGVLSLERDRVLLTLEREGLLRRNASLPLPLLPARVGLVTSAGSAAMADFVHELESTGYGWEVVVADSRVQGDGASRTIAAAVGTLGRRTVDVIALIRGGGARTDLATFDSEEVARAIALAPVPVFTGVGHEIDSSVADAVAHTSFKTPTACAAGLVALVREARRRATDAWSSVALGAQRIVAREAGRLDERSQAAVRRPLARVELERDRLDGRTRRLVRGPLTALAHADHTVELLAARAAAVDPSLLARRGWSVARDRDGRVVRSIDDTQAGDHLMTELVDGIVESQVVGIHRRTPPTSPPPPPKT